MLTRKRLLAAMQHSIPRDHSYPLVRFTTDQTPELKPGDTIGIDFGNQSYHSQQRVYVVDSITHTPEGGMNISAHAPMIDEAPLGEKTYDVVLGLPKGRVGFFSNEGPAPKTMSCP